MIKHCIVPVAAGLAISSSSTALCAPATAPTDVPVKQVVLFSSGVGYFEHAGTVSGNGSTELRFKSNQINDILKSLVLQDTDGGTVTAVNYPSQDPLNKTLKSFQVDITNNPSMADLLSQLRGAKVQVDAVGEKVEGVVLGVERKQRAADKGEPIQVPVLNILTGASFRSIEMDQISDLKLLDPQLEDELHKALAALATSRDQDKKPVTINFAGKGDRNVRIGYVVETPIWKTSYRLILESDKAAKLQGWAIVENQTDSDWKDVNLSLVSGRPISFVMDLYQPLYIPRPVVMPELYASLKPQKYQDGMENDATASGPPAAADKMMRALPEGSAGLAYQSARRKVGSAGQGAFEVTTLSAAAPLDAVASVATIASTASVGELFQYTIGDVTLARQSSAMLPIVTDDVEIERVSIYNASVLPRNPLNGARLKNTTGKHLLQGPITVLQDDSYAGDAQIDNLPPEQERLLSYGIDLQMLVDSTKNRSENHIVSGQINKGVLTISRKTVSDQDYVAENKSDRDRTLVVEHPIKQGWTLVDSPKPIETTDTLYRFKTNVEKGKSKTLTVKEEIVQGETVAILPGDVGQVEFYSRNGEIPKNVRDALGKAVTLKRSVIDSERGIADHTKQIEQIGTEQERIRQNMRTVENNSQYYQRLMTKLNEQESQIEKLQGERDDLQTKRDAQRKELEDYLADLNVG